MKKIQIFLRLLWLQISESFTEQYSLDRIMLIATFIGATLAALFIATIGGAANILEIIVSVLIPVFPFLILILVKNISGVIIRLKYQKWAFEKLAIAIPFKKFAQESDTFSLSAFQKFTKLMVEAQQNEFVLTYNKSITISDSANFADVWIHFPSKDDYLIYKLSK